MKNNVSIFRYICLSNNTKSFVPPCLRHRVVRGRLGNLVPTTNIKPCSYVPGIIYVC